MFICSYVHVHVHVMYMCKSDTLPIRGGQICLTTAAGMSQAGRGSSSVKNTSTSTVSPRAPLGRSNHTHL